MMSPDLTLVPEGVVGRVSSERFDAELQHWVTCESCHRRDDQQPPHILILAPVKSDPNAGDIAPQTSGNGSLLWHPLTFRLNKPTIPGWI